MGSGSGRAKGRAGGQAAERVGGLLTGVAVWRRAAGLERVQAAGRAAGLAVEASAGTAWETGTAEGVALVGRAEAAAAGTGAGAAAVSAVAVGALGAEAVRAAVAALEPGVAWEGKQIERRGVAASARKPAVTAPPLVQQTELT